jgi:hypothetical protein
MSLTLRNVKGSPLTYTEMDNNLTYLEGVAGATGGTGIFDDLVVSGTSSLGDVTGGTGILDDLVVSGTSSLGDVVIADTKKIKGALGSLNLEVIDSDLSSNLDLNPSYQTRLYVVDNDASQECALEMACNIAEDANFIGLYTGSDGFVELQPGVDGGLTIYNLPTYANNAAAVSGGLEGMMVYKTSTGELRIVI